MTTHSPPHLLARLKDRHISVPTLIEAACHTHELRSAGSGAERELALLKTGIYTNTEIAIYKTHTKREHGTCMGGYVLLCARSQFWTAGLS